ncbi:unnamed protein product [Toxocara canis]|uniref:Retrovirus-related Pol polyprotein from transposon TNT 1-94 n=1 Tax=Toxocara canis TaxID=6265 RepID=A0A183UP45_TOXCA|nr:unnamed protein product [Toxocara canis]
MQGVAERAENTPDGINQTPLPVTQTPTFVQQQTAILCQSGPPEQNMQGVAERAENAPDGINRTPFPAAQLETFAIPTAPRGAAEALEAFQAAQDVHQPVIAAPNLPPVTLPQPEQKLPSSQPQLNKSAPSPAASSAPSAEPYEDEEYFHGQLRPNWKPRPQMESDLPAFALWKGDLTKRATMMDTTTKSRRIDASKCVGSIHGKRIDM